MCYSVCGYCGEKKGKKNLAFKNNNMTTIHLASSVSGFSCCSCGYFMWVVDSLHCRESSDYHMKKKEKKSVIKKTLAQLKGGRRRKQNQFWCESMATVQPVSLTHKIRWPTHPPAKRALGVKHIWNFSHKKQTVSGHSGYCLS